jgi:integrase
MMHAVNVIVFRRVDSNTGRLRKYFETQWTDPVTGRKRTRSTGKTTEAEAKKAAAVIEHDLRNGEYKSPSRITWQDFRDRYETEVLPRQARNTAGSVFSTFAAVERLINPKLLRNLDAAQISRFQEKLGREGKAEATIKSYLTHLKAALRWAHGVEILDKMPQIKMPKRTGGMKGRPITTEEFERMLAKVANGLLTVKECEKPRQQQKTVAPEIVASWRYLLCGLWWSGLRLDEALHLQWTDDRDLCVDFSGRRPMFRIRATAQKSHRDEHLPMAPEFAEFLLQTPEVERTGFVFNPVPRKQQRGRIKLQWASAVISSIGKSAGVKVAEKATGKVKHASAHDLRRAFGFRWSNRVMPPILQQMMRHANIQTTMEFYVGRNAEAAADAIWAALPSGFANEFANAPEFASEQNLTTVAGS